MGLTRRVFDRLHFESHWRCAEPVVVLESDDWGLERKPCAPLLARLSGGQPTQWAEESTETPADVDALAELLASYRDEFGQAACLTANFVMTNPDYRKVRESRFDVYESIDLDAGLPPRLMAAYRRSIDAHVFSPQYHGLRHFSPAALLRDLRQDVRDARTLFEAGAAMGPSFVKGHLWRYHSEYEDWHGRGPAYLDSPTADLRRGLDCFERCFGFRSASTIPPHYLWSDAMREAIWLSDLRYIQGAGYRLRRGADGTTVSSRYLGFADARGIVHLCRTAKLEPRPGRTETAARSVAQATQLFEAGVPVVLDTHRINYTGVFRDGGLAALRQFLDGVERFRPRFLSTEQLGDAIASGGNFTLRGGGAGLLTPLGKSTVKMARMTLAAT